MPRSRRRPQWLVPAGLVALSLVPVVAGAVRVGQLATHVPVTSQNARFIATSARRRAHRRGVGVLHPWRPAVRPAAPSPPVAPHLGPGSSCPPASSPPWPGCGWRSSTTCPRPTTVPLRSCASASAQAWSCPWSWAWSPCPPSRLPDPPRLGDARLCDRDRGRHPGAHHDPVGRRRGSAVGHASRGPPGRRAGSSTWWSRSTPSVVGRCRRFLRRRHGARPSLQ